MVRAVWAGLAYFAVVFAAGFGLGTLRVLILAPRLGESVSVLLELPIILAVSWAACRWLLTRFSVSSTLSARLVMGAVALVVLLTAEIGVSVLGFGRSLSAHLDQYRQLPAIIGLAGQVAFAAFPIIQRTNEIRRARFVDP
jgi:hypothetical protein